MNNEQIITRLNQIHDRVKEIIGEKITLGQKMEHNQIHPLLYLAKLNVLDLESELLENELEDIGLEVKMNIVLNQAKIVLEKCG